MPNQTKLPLYRAQILRMWLETSAHHPAAWRFSLEEIGTQSRSGFADLAALVEHLQDSMEQLPKQLSDKQPISE